MQHHNSCVESPQGLQKCPVSSWWAHWKRGGRAQSQTPFAQWCELCIANRCQQDPHPAQRDGGSSAHSTVSFDFGFGFRNDHHPEACGLFIYDRQTGAMHVVPTPQKGGRHLQSVCAEFYRFLVWLGHTTVGLRCDQEPSTLSLLGAVQKSCTGLGIRVMDETVAPGSHASNGVAEVTVKVLRRHANLLIEQIEQGRGLSGAIGCRHPLYQWSLLHSAWLHNRYVVRHGKTAYEPWALQYRQYTGRAALWWKSFGFFWNLPQKVHLHWSRVFGWLKPWATMSTSLQFLAISNSLSLGVWAWTWRWLVLSVAVWTCFTWSPVGARKEDFSSSSSFTGSC